MKARGWGSAVALGLLVWAATQRMDVAFAIVVVALPMTLLEAWRPLHRRRPALSRTGAGTDVVNFVVSEALGLIATIGVLAALAPLVADVMPVMLREHLARQVGWVRWIEAIVIAEVGGYWGHRLCHQIPLLWRFHRVHHSSTDLDWLAAGRRHPIDATWARLSTALPMLLLGFAVPTVATVFVIKRLRGLLVHANVNLRWRKLERLYVTPFFHHWHHSNEPGTWNTNYAVSFPVVDWMFGTLHLPDDWPSAYGCDGNVPNRQYVVQLLSPWRNFTPSQPASTTTDHQCQTGEEKESEAFPTPVVPHGAYPASFATSSGSGAVRCAPTDLPRSLADTCPGADLHFPIAQAAPMKLPLAWDRRQALVITSTR